MSSFGGCGCTKRRSSFFLNLEKELMEQGKHDIVLDVSTTSKLEH